MKKETSAEATAQIKATQITRFKNIFDTQGGITVSIEQFCNAVSQGLCKDQVKLVRDAKDKATRDKLKQKLPNVTISGEFSKRGVKHLTQLSGLIAMDFDNLGDGLSEAKTKLANDPYTYMVFTSVSGNGLCTIVKTTKDKENHIKHFFSLQKYYKSEYGLEIDKSCKDFSRARFVSYDPDAKLIEGSLVAGLSEAEPNLFEDQKEAKTAPKRALVKDATFDLKEFERVVNRIENESIAIVSDYDKYFRLALAFSTQLGEAGRGYFHRVCSQSPRYNFDDANAKYDNAITTGRGAVGIGTFFKYAKDQGVNTRYVQTRRSKNSKKKGGDDRALHVQVVDYITNGGAGIKHFINEFDGKVYFERNGKKILMTTSMLDTLYTSTVTHFNTSFPKDWLTIALNQESAPRFHPIKDVFEGFEKECERDPGIIDRIVNIMPFKDKVSHQFWKKWLLSLYNTINRNDHRYIMLLQGKQRFGKSSIFKRLMPEELNSFHKLNDLADAREAKTHLGENVLTNIDEFDGLNQKEHKLLRELATSDSNVLMRKYSNENTPLKRTSLICGSTNYNNVLPSGESTRFLLCQLQNLGSKEIKKFRAAFNAIDKKVLFNELYILGREDAKCHEFSDDEWDALAESNSKETELNIEEDEILNFVSNPGTSGTAYFVNASFLFKSFQKSNPSIRYSLNKVGKALNNVALFKDSNGNPVSHVLSRHKHRDGYWIVFKSTLGLGDISNLPTKEVIDDTPPDGGGTPDGGTPNNTPVNDSPTVSDAPAGNDLAKENAELKAKLEAMERQMAALINDGVVPDAVSDAEKETAQDAIPEPVTNTAQEATPDAISDSGDDTPDAENDSGDGNIVEEKKTPIDNKDIDWSDTMGNTAPF